MSLSKTLYPLFSSQILSRIPVISMCFQAEPNSVGSGQLAPQNNARLHLKGFQKRDKLEHIKQKQLKQENYKPLAGMKNILWTTLLPQFYLANQQHSGCKHVFLIRVETVIDPNGIATADASQSRSTLRKLGVKREVGMCLNCFK